MEVWASLGNGPNTVSESTVSNTELSEFFLALTEFRGENSVSSSQPIICVPKRTHRVFLAELTDFAEKLSEAQSSFLRYSTLKTVFRLFPISGMDPSLIHSKAPHVINTVVRNSENFISNNSTTHCPVRPFSLNLGGEHLLCRCRGWWP